MKAAALASGTVDELGAAGLAVLEPSNLKVAIKMLNLSPAAGPMSARGRPKSRALVVVCPPGAWGMT